MLATTRVSILRGTTQTAAGDDADTGAPVAGLIDFPMQLLERNRTVYFVESDERRTVREVRGRCTPRDIRAGDIVLDLTTARRYAVDEVTGGERTLSGTKPLLLDLRKL